MPDVNLKTPQKSARSEIASKKTRTPLLLKRKMSSSDFCHIRGRDQEITQIKSFIQRCIKDETAGSLFVSGKPGTGKTLCVKRVYSEHQGEKLMKNCMSLVDSGKNLYRDLLLGLNGKQSGIATPRRNLRSTPSTPSSTNREIANLERVITDTDEPMKLVVLDEIDEISDQDVLRNIFNWTAREDSRIVLIGISNRLDLAEKHCKETSCLVKSVLHFKPYSVQQIKEILMERISEAQEDGAKMDSVAIELCARKIANKTGDVRTALEICKWGINEAEKQKKLRSQEGDENENDDLEVKAAHINAAFQQESSLKSTSKLPLEQKVMICCGLILVREKKTMNVGTLMEKFRQKSQSTALSDTDIMTVLDFLVTGGIFRTKKNKNPRAQEVYFAISEETAEIELAGKPLLDSLLNS